VTDHGTSPAHAQVSGLNGRKAMESPTRCVHTEPHGCANPRVKVGVETVDYGNRRANREAIRAMNAPYSSRSPGCGAGGSVQIVQGPTLSQLTTTLQ